MRFFENTTSIDFLGKRRLAFLMSGLFILISLVSFVTRGLNMGIDFTGGTVIEVGYPNAADLDAIRSALQGADFQDAVVQHFGTSKDVLIRVAPRKNLASAQISDQVMQALQAKTPNVEKRRVEFVGPQVGEHLALQGSLAMLYALFGILVYVAFRFEKRFALGSVAALVHDVIITVGVFSLFQVEFNLTVLAAVLAVIGYSLNDTIVVFDRIRENFVKIRKGTTVDNMNASINQTLSRTLMTSGTTLIVVVCLYALGGETISGFALALLVGIGVGTYSSIYIASALALALGVSKQDLIPPEKPGAEQAP